MKHETMALIVRMPPNILSAPKLFSRLGTFTPLRAGRDRAAAWQAIWLACLIAGDSSRLGRAPGIAMVIGDLSLGGSIISGCFSAETISHQ